MSEIRFDASGESTAEIEDCDNFGCAANKDGACTMTFGECFGYIEPSGITQGCAHTEKGLCDKCLSEVDSF